MKKDEIIEELWRIKDELSSSCENNIKKLVQKMNMIAQEQGLLGEELDQRNKSEIA